MSRLLRAVPWALLALSLAANAWLLARPRSPASPPLRPETGFVTNRVTTRGSSEESNVTRLATNSSPTTSTPPPGSPSVSLSAYATLVATSQETAEQHDDLARVLARWIATAPADAAEWVAAQTAVGDDPRFDPALSQLATHLVAQGRFDTARAWAESIRSPEVRAWAFEEILAEQYRARQLDPAALQAAAAHAGIPAERVRAILDYSRLD